MRDPVGYVPVGYVPLARAAICLDCEAIFTVGPCCPACASEHQVPLAKWLSSKATPLNPQTVTLDTMLDYLDRTLGDRPRRMYADGSGYEILNQEAP